MSAVKLENRDGILIITLDRPKANAIDVATSLELYAAFKTLNDDPGLRVGVITGTGRFFSAGWDLGAANDGEAVDADHGPGGFHDWDLPEKTCLWERSAIFNAYYLPGIDETLLRPDMAPVNSFRFVLNEYFDANLDYLPDKTYFTSHRLIRQIIEVTEGRDSTLNCP